jgi:hypothetical protein
VSLEGPFPPTEFRAAAPPAVKAKGLTSFVSLALVNGSAGYVNPVYRVLFNLVVKAGGRTPLIRRVFSLSKPFHQSRQRDRGVRLGSLGQSTINMPSLVQELGLPLLRAKIFWVEVGLPRVQLPPKSHG